MGSCSWLLTAELMLSQRTSPRTWLPGSPSPTPRKALPASQLPTVLFDLGDKMGVGMAGS